MKNEIFGSRFGRGSARDLVDLGDSSRRHGDQASVQHAVASSQLYSSDFATVFAAAKYESGQSAMWTEGDRTGNGIFNKSGFAAAFAGAGNEQGSRDGGLTVVPEQESSL